MRAIEIRTIEHQHQRNNEVADWYQPYGMPMKIVVSNMENPDFEFLSAICGLVDMHLTARQGVVDRTALNGYRSEANMIVGYVADILNISLSGYYQAETKCNTP